MYAYIYQYIYTDTCTIQPFTHTHPFLTTLSRNRSAMASWSIVSASPSTSVEMYVCSIQNTAI